MRSSSRWKATSDSVVSAADDCLLLKGSQFGQGGGEKIRNRRMNTHCALYHRIGSLRGHEVQPDLNQFIASGPKNRSPQNLKTLSASRTSSLTTTVRDDIKRAWPWMTAQFDDAKSARRRIHSTEF